MSFEQEFYNHFQVSPEYRYRAPARINLIGEHIDYNGGKVLPAAISCYIKAIVSKREDNTISAYSTNTKNGHSVDINSIKYDESNGWCNYVFGVFYTLQSMGYRIPFGLNILVYSEIPLGSGLSSSAALLDLITYIANDIYDTVKKEHSNILDTGRLRAIAIYKIVSELQTIKGKQDVFLDTNSRRMNELIKLVDSIESPI